MIDVNIVGLTKKFDGSTVAIDKLDLKIRSGELFFLLGPSGCGKTTLLRSLAGFYTLDGGKIFFGKTDVSKLPPYKRNTGMVFQSYALWPHMTVAENVAFGLEQQKLPKAEIKSRVDKVLQLVKMDMYVSRKPNELSGGQQQRVALARALVVRPQCLLLDEPLSNLDAQLRNEMREEIRRICKKFKLTTVYVTHDQKEALSIADRIAVLSKGKIEQVGTPMELYKRPKNKFVANFIGETNILEGTVIRAGAGEAYVKTAIGDFRGMLTDYATEPKAGDTVYVSIRPESIRLQHEPWEENSVDGDIGRATYFGEVAHYEMVKNGVALRISELNPCHLGQNQRRGLHACVLPEDVVVLTQ